MNMVGTTQRGGVGEMSWISRKLLLYNVTFGLYGLDWWERYLFNTVVLIIMSLFFYSTTKPIWQVFDNHLNSQE